MRKKGKKMKKPGGLGALIIALTVFFLYVALKPDWQERINVRDIQSLLPKEIANLPKEITKEINRRAGMINERPVRERPPREHSKPASPLHMRILKVSDGDTVTVENTVTMEIFKCRLYGIDAPETPKHGTPGQPYGEDSARALKTLVSGEQVEITTTGEKTYDREVCTVRAGGADINLEMVKRGYAWAYRRYLHGPYASEYIEAEGEARRNRLGVWHDINPTPPWEFRRRHKV